MSATTTCDKCNGTGNVIAAPQARVVDDGGLAFPHTGEGLGAEFAATGMSLRDYFIAHAPPEPWRFFEPTMPPKPREPDRTPIGNEGEAPTDDQLRNLRDWVRDPCWDPETEYPAFSMWVTWWRAYWKARDTWQEVRDHQHYMQWPCFWADVMIAQRKKGPA